MSARGDDDPLAGATIVVHDLSRANGIAPGAESHSRGAPAASPESPAPATSPPAAGAPAASSDRWQLLRGLLLLAAGATFGAFGYATWLGRPPTSITFGTLGAAPKVEIRVQVDGAVAQPGVYRLAQGDRVEDAIKAAGGLAPHADPTKLRQAERVRDEQRLDVPSLPAAAGAVEGAVDTSASQGQTGSSGSSTPSQPAPATSAQSQGTVAARPTSTPRPQATARPTSTPRAQPTARATAFAGGKVNVNTASQAQLEQLPGFGATSAAPSTHLQVIRLPPDVSAQHVTSLPVLGADGAIHAVRRRTPNFAFPLEDVFNHRKLSLIE